MNRIEDDVIELQTRLSFQEDMLAQLNDIITKQDAELIALKQQMMILAQRLKELQSNPLAGSGDVIQEKPPHY